MGDVLTYAGLVLVAYDLVKGMIVNPIRAFYKDVVFHDGCVFRSYSADVLTRDKNEYRACLLYLRDFMGVLGDSDIACIEELRAHRHVIGHELPSLVREFPIDDYLDLMARVDATLFKLSNHHAYIELGADPISVGWDWSQVWGPEYILFNEVVAQVRAMSHLASHRTGP
jgi:hypothetical protein